jgi:uncharacterized membrane protein YeaQ/YmgE (transglycosylase-associated protein family)
MSILWTIIIGFLAGVIARFLHPGNKYEPKGFILTTLLGIVGAFLATYLGQAIGWYQAGEGAGFHWGNRWRNNSPGSVGISCTSLGANIGHYNDWSHQNAARAAAEISGRRTIRKGEGAS